MMANMHSCIRDCAVFLDLVLSSGCVYPSDWNLSSWEMTFGWWGAAVVDATIFSGVWLVMGELYHCCLIVLPAIIYLHWLLLGLTCCCSFVGMAFCFLSHPWLYGVVPIGAALLFHFFFSCFLASLWKIVTIHVSCSFSVPPMFVGTSPCITITSCFAANTAASVIIIFGAVMYWCLKNNVSTNFSCMLFLSFDSVKCQVFCLYGVILISQVFWCDPLGNFAS